MPKLSSKRYKEILKYVLLNRIKRDYIYPFYASFKVTHKCNMRCSFCNVWMEKTADLPTKGILKILDNIGNSSIVVVSLEGGDPLLRPDLMKILKHAYKKPFYLFFTTNGSLLDKNPMKKYCKYIDFLHISIDEGHNNLGLFERLEEFQNYGAPICVQIVVTKNTLDALESKVKKVYEADARTVIMPAVYLSGTKNVYPKPNKFRDKILMLKNKYKNTIITTDGFLDNINKPNGCSSSSVIIDSDGGLFYPCRQLESKPFNLLEGSLIEFLESKKAEEYRKKMKLCRKKCGWYQYFATSTFASSKSFFSSIKPYIPRLRNNIINRMT